MSLPEDLLRELLRRRYIIEKYYENYLKHLEGREYDKASEDLWGIVNNLASMLGLLLVGKPIGRHDELRKFINDLISSKGDVRLKELLLACERLHANFFHNFMDEQQFEEHRVKAEEFISILKKYITDELKKYGITI